MARRIRDRQSFWLCLRRTESARAQRPLPITAIETAFILLSPHSSVFAQKTRHHYRETPRWLLCLLYLRSRKAEGMCTHGRASPTPNAGSCRFGRQRGGLRSDGKELPSALHTGLGRPGSIVCLRIALSPRGIVARIRILCVRWRHRGFILSHRFWGRKFTLLMADYASCSPWWVSHRLLIRNTIRNCALKIPRALNSATEPPVFKLNLLWMRCVRFVLRHCLLAPSPLVGIPARCRLHHTPEAQAWSVITALHARSAGGARNISAEAVAASAHGIESCLFVGGNTPLLFWIDAISAVLIGRNEKLACPLQYISAHVPYPERRLVQS